MNDRRCTTFFCLLLLAAPAMTGGCARTTVLAPKAERTEEVGLLMRLQYVEDPYIERIFRHVDTLLPDGRLVGFNNKHEQTGAIIDFLSMRGKGVVRDGEWYREHRTQYVDAELAQNVERGAPGQKLVTVWARFTVTPGQARKLLESWERIEREPPPFSLLNLNCATRAHNALVEAGILKGPLVGLHFVYPLLHKLRAAYGDELELELGYFGLDESGRAYMIPLPLPDPEKVGYPLYLQWMRQYCTTGRLDQVGSSCGE